MIFPVLTFKIEQRFNELFERDVAVYFFSTGTAINSPALAAVNRPGGVSFLVSRFAIEDDEVDRFLERLR